MQQWRLKDYVFAAFMTIGMVISVIVVGPFAPPPLQLLVWSPLGSIFLTLGMARLQRRGSVALMILPLALLLGLISPLMTLYLAVTVLITEGVILLLGNYRRKANRLVGNVIFFASANLGGILVVAYFLGGSGDNAVINRVTQPWLLTVLTLVAAGGGALGWWLGELGVQQLRKAGKLDVDG